MTEGSAGLQVLVTGGAGGLGRSIAGQFLADGATAVVIAEPSLSVAQAAGEGDSRIHGVALDVTDEGAWVTTLHEIDSRLGGLDVVVNNAGITLRRGILETDLDDWKRVVDVNLNGVFLGLKHGGAHLRARGGGSMVNIASVAGHTGYSAAAYAATKWAVRGLTAVAADELGPSGVRVNSVSPGWVATDLTTDITETVRRYTASTPLGSPVSPDDVARAVVFLASRRAAATTGEDLRVDGGFLANATRQLMSRE